MSLLYLLSKKITWDTFPFHISLIFRLFHFGQEKKGITKGKEIQQGFKDYQRKLFALAVLFVVIHKLRPRLHLGFFSF